MNTGKTYKGAALAVRQSRPGGALGWTVSFVAVRAPALLKSDIHGGDTCREADTPRWDAGLESRP